jgi:DUF4097 and DUF4098 domain-containing protein YvlB
MDPKQVQRVRLAVVLVSLAGAAAAQAADRYAEGSFDRTLSVTIPVNLDVVTGAGDIIVRVGTDSAVRVIAKIRARIGNGISESEAREKVRRLETNPPIEQDNNQIRIGHLKDSTLKRNVSISYELTVPASTRLHAVTGSGDQSIADISGPVEANTGSGNIRISKIGSNVRVSTGSGDIELNSVQGGVRATTGSGDISASRVAGATEVVTGSGSIYLSQTGVGDVNAQTGSGNIELVGVRGTIRARTGSGDIVAQGQPTGDWKLQTSSGSITVRLPQDAAFDLRASTSSGDIKTGHPITFQGKVSGKVLDGQVRGGGPLLELHTDSGSIRIE